MSRQLDGTGLKRLHREWRRRTPGRLALVLDGVQGPFNLGAIIRTAAAYRVDEMWIAGDTTPANPRVAKTALGTDRYLRWARVDSGEAGVAAARRAGYGTVVAVELTDDAVALHECALGDDVALVLGHEDRGVAPATLAAVDRVAYIPQLGRVGSLNVATAAAIACYEVRRRHWTGDIDRA